MNTRRRRLIAAGLASLAFGNVRAAAPPQKTFVIGVLYPNSRETAAHDDKSFDAHMAALGYVEGKNMRVERRYASDDYGRMPALAADLVARKVQVILVNGTPGTLAAKNATSRIPIVGWNIGDALGSGIVANLGRPEANVTGTTNLAAELAAKRIEMLLALSATTRKVAVLFNPDNPGNKAQVATLEEMKGPLRIDPTFLPIRSADDLNRALGEQAKGRYNALYMSQDAVLKSAPVAQFSLQHRLPSVGPTLIFVRNGGLLSFGVDRDAELRQAVDYVDRILNGAMPRDLPFLRPKSFETGINLKTAKALGIEVPQHMLISAQLVVE